MLYWLAPYTKGMATMATLIVAIGIQNVFVLRQGVKREAVFMTVTICFLCDVLLVTLGTAGLGALIAASPILSAIVAFGGAAFLLFYGVRALRAAKKAAGLDLGAAQGISRTTVAMTAFAVSLLNPHAILDTVVIVGGVATRYDGVLRAACALGAVTMSGIWFYGLGYGARWLAPVLGRRKIWRIIDLVIGVMMLSLAFSLARDGWVLLKE
jgi:L-lysine exporter family protein LysE/ArgO